jgi:putative alpha-1,2-mannosidase
MTAEFRITIVVAVPADLFLRSAAINKLLPAMEKFQAAILAAGLEATCDSRVVRQRSNQYKELVEPQIAILEAAPHPDEATSGTQ